MIAIGIDRWIHFWIGEIIMYDIIIIGSGVIGSSIARELSRYRCNVCVLEKDEDLCSETSKANSGIVHSGVDAKPGSNKAHFNLLGNGMMEDLSKELDFPFHRNGSLIIAFTEDDMGKLEEMLEQGKANGVKGLEIINQDRLRLMEPNISEDGYAALYAPTGGIVCPFKLTIAMAENANVNGVDFHFNTKVELIEKQEDHYRLITNRGTYTSNIVVNAAGVYADELHNMVSEDKIKIVARKGEYCLLDKSVGDYVDKTIFQLPTQYGKGVLVTPTIHGNLLIGPTAYDVEDKEGINTTDAGIKEVIAKASLSVKKLPIKQVITSFAGLRAHSIEDDFIIGEIKDSPGFFDAAGIESPGLTSAPAIGQHMAELIAKKYYFSKKDDFIARRKDVISIAEGKEEDRVKLIKEKPEFANVICRCELVTEGEIIDAIHRPLGAKTLDGIKRRTRVGAGRCQAGFCAPKTMEILMRELQEDPFHISKAGGKSTLLVGENKEDL